MTDTTPTDHLTVNLDGQSFTIEKGQTILDAALVEGIDLDYSCQIGSCATCKCKLLAGEIRALSEFDYVLTEQEIEQGYILTCQSSAKTDVQLSTANQT